MTPDVIVGYFRFNRWTNKVISAQEFPCVTFDGALKLVYVFWKVTPDDLIIIDTGTEQVLYRRRKTLWYKEYILIRAL